nr:N-terminal phage integrase SAM-like domain-containing protein [Actinopolymorpha cephalotaxi]
MLDRWLNVIDVEPSTRQGYERKISKHIRPILGKVKVGRLDPETLESFYADLRRCREHCGGRLYVEHRTRLPHECDEHPSAACRPAKPATCRDC